jgi:thioredoxin-like negative regulator of GroEL
MADSQSTPASTVRSAAAAKITADTPRPPTPPPALWKRLLPFRVQRTNDGLRLRVAWRQAVLMLFLLMFLGWFGAAGLAYLFVKYRRDFPAVRYTHMLFYPARQAEYRAARGDFLIDRAKEQLKEQQYREAFYNLRVGSSFSPGNRDGRMLLAQFYVVWQRPDLAHKLLVEGLPANRHDREYLQTVFSFLLQRQADNDVIAITSDLLGTANPGAALDDRARLIAMARATAQFFRGNYDAAEDTLRIYRLMEIPDGQILALRIEWERGERDTALARLQALTEQIPENEQIYAQYAAYLRETGRDDELRRLCVLRQLTYPDRPRPRIDLLYLYDKARDEPAVQTGIADLFRDFPKNPEVLLALADFAANTGRPALARRIYEYCKENELPWEGPALMTVEAHVVAKEYNEALEACRQMVKDNPEWGKRFYSVFNGLQAIANYGLGDIEAAQLFLNNFLNQAGVRADNLVAVSNRLITVGARDQARQVLAQAVRADPLNQTALNGLIRLDLDLGHTETLAANLRTLLTMRKPPRELLQTAYDRLASDRYLFAPGRSALLEELRVTITSRPTLGSS